MTDGIRVLANAESFGFGPSAAIASMASALRPCFARMDYAGDGHTLDLQSEVGYDTVIGVDAGVRFRALVREYDLFLTAMDFERARIACEEGVPTIVYDALAWYWPRLPDVLGRVRLYLAQDFYGVRERLRSAGLDGSRAIVVSPLASRLPAGPGEPESKRELTLVNLGGIQNPHWSHGTATQYARMVLEALMPLLGGKTVITASRRVAEALPEFDIRTYGPAQMQSLLRTVRRAFVTPGLGNVYEVGVYGIPAVFLPPANDSQARQARQLLDAGDCDYVVDWAALGYPIDYRASQQQILADIASAIGRERRDGVVRLRHQMAVAMSVISGMTTSRTTRLVERFGSGGLEQVVGEIARSAESLRNGAP